MNGVVVVGLGRIGMAYDLHLDSRTHVLSHARAFTEHPRFQVMAGVDPDPSRRQTFERAYLCPAFGDIESALRDHQPDLVVVAVPTRLHRETVERVLAAAQPRALLCEKPLAYDRADAQTMVQNCDARGVALFVNYMRRSEPGAIEIARRLASGVIATPVKGVAWYSKGFLHNGSHFFNLLQLWLGAAQGSDVLDAGRLWDGIDPEPDVRVRFANGAVVFLAAREEQFSHYTVELVAANGRLRYERGGEQILWQAAVPAPHAEGDVVLGEPEPICSGMNRYQWHVADQLARELEGQPAHLCSGAEAYRTLAAMHTIINRQGP